MPCTFTPDPCSALTIQNLLLLRKCLTGSGSGGSKSQEQNDKMLSIDLKSPKLRGLLDDFYNCLLVALKCAYEKAGCPFPTIPDFPSLPNLQPCTDAVDALVNNSSNQLSRVDPFISMVLTAACLPTSITVK